MFNVLKYSLVLLTLLSCGCAQKNAAGPTTPVDFDSLLSAMTNLNTFAEAPIGDSYLESSYDRTGGNKDWGEFYEAEPSGRFTLLDLEGPGYISRFWIASFAAERWMFFIDGESEPRLDLAKDDLFGEKFPFHAPLAGKSGGGRYSLVPIPFSKSLRVEVVPTSLKRANRNYFQINYTLLNQPSKSVESFPVALSVAQSNHVVAVNQSLSGHDELMQQLVKENLSEVKTQKLEVGDSLSIWQDEGAGLLESFAIRIDEPTADAAMSQELLRTLRLQMYWDGASHPSVDVPLGDFFCNPFYFRSFTSMALGRVDDAFVCRFPMPYAQGARCVLVNKSKGPVSISAGAQGDVNESKGLTRKFHAMWRASTKSGIPFQMMSTSGSGHFIGLFLNAIGQDGSWNILEGDEILRPDPGVRAAQLGTGLEDYFSGAYYYTSLFDLPLHGLIEKGAMRTDQYRFHMLDAVPFDKSFNAGIEFGHGNQAKGYLSSVAYWYADEPASASLYTSKEHLLLRPKDRFELHGLMAQLFLLERGGLYHDAADRMSFFAKRYAGQPWADLLKARALGYREFDEGFAALKGDYMNMTNSAFAGAAQTAKDRLWLEEDKSNSLLGIHAIGRYKLYLDGKLIGEGEGKGELRVFRTSLSKGAHSWEIDIEPTHQGSFFTLCQRTSDGDIFSEGDWEILETTALEGRALPESFEGNQVLPNMTVWAFNPNAYIGMQSPGVAVTLWRFFEAQPFLRRVRLKKEWSTDDAVKKVSARELQRSDEEEKANAVN